MKLVYFFLLLAVVSLSTGCGSSYMDETSESTPETADEPAALRESKATSNPGLIRSNSLAPQLASSSDHGGGFGWKNDRCFLCHSIADLKETHDFGPSLAASFSNLGEEVVGLCLYCHGANGLSGVTTDSYQCIYCHTDSTISAAGDMFGGHNMHDLNADGRMDNADCVICHSSTDMNGEIEAAVDVTPGPSAYQNISEFCLNCHDGNGALGIMPPPLSIDTDVNNIYSTYKGIGEESADWEQTADIHGARHGSGSDQSEKTPGSNGQGGPNESGASHGQNGSRGAGSDSGESGGYGKGNGAQKRFGRFRGSYEGSTEVACLDCHQAHSSDNPYLIAENGAGAEFADDDAKAAAVLVTDSNFTQLCALCHTSADGAPTDNGLTEVWHPGTYSTSCTECHYHGAGFNGFQQGLF